MSTESYFTVDLPVRISEVNYGNHLGHAALTSLIHQTKILYFREFNIDERNINGNGAIVKRLEIDYKGEAHFDDMLHVNVRVNAITRTTCILEYVVTKNEANTPVTHVFETLAFINYESRKPVRTPDEIKAMSAD